MTSRDQVTIPREVRQRLGIRKGDRFLFALSGDGSVRVRKVEPRSLRDVLGLLGRPPRRLTVEQMDQALRRRVGKSAARG